MEKISAGAAVDTVTHKGIVHLQLVWGIKGRLETSLPEGPRSRVTGNTGDGEEIVKELLCRHLPMIESTRSSPMEVNRG